MLRRSHKKSKGGCTECKRRHVKCDENRPVCRLCAVSERHCSYASQAQGEIPVIAASGFHEQCSELPWSNRLIFNELPANSLVTPSPRSISAGQPLLRSSYDASADVAVNLDHMDLLIHVIQDSDMFNLGTGVESYHPSGLRLGLKEANKAPYLLHGLLAFSAQHLAHLYRERSEHYLHQAVSLQTRAISLFNATWTEVNESNCVAVLLFSSVLGHHLLAETLSKRNLGGLDSFIERYVQCVNMHRGIYVIADSAWPLLMKTELEPILSMSHKFTSREPSGHECQPLHNLIANALNLSVEEKKAIRTAINYLQIGFDAGNAEMESDQNRHQMIYSWTMLIPLGLANMLKYKASEALVILAYYTVLLHRGRTLWQVGDAGAYIFDLIAKHLGPEWEPHLRYPREQIRHGAYYNKPNSSASSSSHSMSRLVH